MEKQYCVYITFYRGNKLPPFYVGFSTVKKVNNGYNGSVSSKTYKNVWREERKENRNLFITKILKTFNSSEEARKYEEFVQRSLNVHRNPLYINMSIGYTHFNMDKAFEDGSHHFLNSEYQSAVNKKRLSENTHQFCLSSFQREMSKRAHQNPNHPFHGGKFAKMLNADRLKNGTHNLLGSGEFTKKVIAEKNDRENVKKLRDLAKSLNLKLGTNWYRKPDVWINAKLDELINTHTKSQ